MVWIIFRNFFSQLFERSLQTRKTQFGAGYHSCVPQNTKQLFAVILQVQVDFFNFLVRNWSYETYSELEIASIFKIFLSASQVSALFMVNIMLFMPSTGPRVFIYASQAKQPSKVLQNRCWAWGNNWVLNFKAFKVSFKLIVLNGSVPKQE